MAYSVRDRIQSRAGTSLIFGAVLVLVFLAAGQAYSSPTSSGISSSGDYQLVDVSGIYRQMNITLMGGYIPVGNPYGWNVGGPAGLSAEQVRFGLSPQVSQLGQMIQPPVQAVSQVLVPGGWTAPFQAQWTNPWSDPNFTPMGFEALAPTGQIAR